VRGTEDEEQFNLKALTMSTVFAICLVIFICGMIGGYANHLLNNNTPETNTRLNLYKSFVMGLISAAVVPLFLHLLSSNILQELGESGKEYLYFVFSGFCLIAAVFSNRFLEGVASSVLKNLENKVANVENKVQEVEEKTDTVVEDMTDDYTDNTTTTTTTNDDDTLPTVPEVDMGGEDNRGRGVNTTKSRQANMTPLQKVEHAFNSGRSSFSTLEGLVKETKLSADEIASIIKTLQQEGKASKMNVKGKEIWKMKKK
jgi:phosphotransferase system  glucose/maltose/N-acetylglucosamine-specific IIC component